MGHFYTTEEIMDAIPPMSKFAAPCTPLPEGETPDEWLDKMNWWRKGNRHYSWKVTYVAYSSNPVCCCRVKMVSQKCSAVVHIPQ